MIMRVSCLARGALSKYQYVHGHRRLDSMPSFSDNGNINQLRDVLCHCEQMLNDSFGKGLRACYRAIDRALIHAPH